MLTPGAATATLADASENEAMAVLVASRAATATAPSAQAGKDTPAVAPWLPEATTTAMPASCTASMADTMAAWLGVLPEQGEGYELSSPRLRFTAAKR